MVAQADLARLQEYALPAAMPLDAVRPKHAPDIVRELRAAGELAPRTIVGLFRTLRTDFESAVVDELIEVDPIKAKPGSSRSNATRIRRGARRPRSPLARSSG